MDYYRLPKEKYGARPHIHRQMKPVQPTIINIPGPHFKRHLKDVVPNFPAATDTHLSGNMKVALPALQPKTGAQFRRFVNATNPFQGDNTNLTLEDLQTNNNLDNLFDDTYHHTSPKPRAVHPGQVQQHMLEVTEAQKQRVYENQLRRRIYKQPLESEDVSGINENFLNHKYSIDNGVYDSALGMKKDDILSESYNYQCFEFMHEYGNALPWRIKYGKKH